MSESPAGVDGMPRRALDGDARPGWTLALLLLPAALAYALLFLTPIATILQMSVYRSLPGGGLEPALTAHNYLALAVDTFRLREVGRTLALGLEVAGITLVMSYPIALFLARTRSRWRGLLTTLVIAPLLTSAVVRTYAWIVILGHRGLVNTVLLGAGLIAAPLALVNNMTGVVIALVQILMPYMTLALLSGFGRLDPDLEAAAMSLGATPWRTFRRITLPLSLPGIATGCLLVFVLTISSFITPRLLGGGRVFLLATDIYEQATYTLNWPLGSAISIALLALSGIIITGYTRALRSLER